MQDKLNIAVFVDYDNIEIGLKSTLRREFDVSLALDALKERGDIVAKFAYANWGRQDGATRPEKTSAHRFDSEVQAWLFPQVLAIARRWLEGSSRTVDRSDAAWRYNTASSRNSW